MICGSARGVVCLRRRLLMAILPAANLRDTTRPVSLHAARAGKP
jgi:hypothetical protein